MLCSISLNLLKLRSNIAVHVESESMIRKDKNFPQLVKEVRRQLKLSQEELANALGVSFATVNRWENVKTMPSKLALKQFSAFCAANTRSGKLKLDNKDTTL